MSSWEFDQKKKIICGKAYLISLKAVGYSGGLAICGQRLFIQNIGKIFKKTRKFLTPWYAHVRVRIKDKKN